MSRTVIIDGDVVVYKVAEAVADSFEVTTDEQDNFIYIVTIYLQTFIKLLYSLIHIYL